MKIRKLLSLILALLLCFTLFACDTDKDDDDDEDEDEDETEVTTLVDVSGVTGSKVDVPVAGADLVSGYVDDYFIAIVGAETVMDDDDKESIRIYYDFTNESDESTSVSMALSTRLEQDGIENDTAYIYDDAVPESDNKYLDIRPGCTIRVAEEFVLTTTGNDVTFTIYDWLDDDEELTATFTPGSLPGAPSTDFEITPVADPNWLAGLSDKGDVDDYYVAIGDAELTEDWDGEQAVRIYFDFTNNSGEDAYPGTLEYKAFQDGVELETAYVYDDDVESDDVLYDDIKDGATVKCSEVFLLRSKSNIEFEVSDYGDDAIGAEYELY